MTAIDTSATCVFCKIADRSDELEHERLAESASAVAFMNAEPAALGHALVIPRIHVQNIWELPSHEGKEVFDLARRVALAAKAAFQPDGLNLFQANGEAGWQSVFHFHIHVVPRWFGDPLIPNWHEPQGKRGDIPQAAEALREAFSAMPLEPLRE